MSYLANRTDSLIGADVHVHGHVSFTGVLRVQGEVIGDITCTSSPDSRDAIVIDNAGRIVGGICSPYVIVKGRLTGSVVSSQNVEVHCGANIVGDVVYRHLDVHAGGVVVGMVTPSMLVNGNSVAWAITDGGNSSELLTGPGRNELGSPIYPSRSEVHGFRFLLKPGLAVIAMGIIAFTIWPKIDSSLPVETTERVVRSDLRAGHDASAVLSSGSIAPSIEPARHDVTSTRSNELLLREADSMPPSGKIKSDEGTVPYGGSHPIAVEGVNPARPTGAVLLVSKELSVLYKRKWDDLSEGQQIEMGAGQKLSIVIASDELLRVAKGRDLTVYFQGRKVSPLAIESGAWMRFVPHPASRQRG